MGDADSLHLRTPIRSRAHEIVSNSPAAPSQANRSPMRGLIVRGGSPQVLFRGWFATF
jgi:hypothetical protein